MKHSVKHSTVRHRLCIGCGVCELVCPEKAIKVEFTRKGEYTAAVDPSRCTACGICIQYCPHARDTLRSRAADVSSAADPLHSGLEECDSYLAFDRSPGRDRSASGGVITWWLGQLLDSGRLDGVIHGEPVVAVEGNPHFCAVFSSSSAELDDRRGSFYASLCFAAVVNKVARNRSRNLAFVGTPCVIRAYRHLFDKHPDFCSNHVVFLALVCSHNVSHNFTDFLYRSMELPSGRPFRLDFRSKEAIPHAGRYRIRVSDQTGKTLAHPDRLECAFTESWRSHAFVANACHYCPDFWGCEADLSAKDAWGSAWAQEPGGTSLIAVRNKDWRRDFANGVDGLYLEKLDTDAFVGSQHAVARYRQQQVSDRWQRVLVSPCNLRSGFARNKLVGWFSRWAWPRIGAKAMNRWIGRLGWVYDGLYRCVSRGRNLLSLMMRLPGFFLAPLLWPFRFFRFRHDGNRDAILVVGGYGYGNLGDEAQLHTSWQKLRELFPGKLIKVLTPDPYATHILHGCPVGEAPRLAFFDADISSMYELNTWQRKVSFLIRALGIYINAFLVRAGTSTFMLRPRRSALLEDIRNASLVFFCGGGYLTGSTRSRLWDGALLGRLCRLFQVPLVLSGQTMGIWQGRFTRRLAHWGFSGAALIGLRDPLASRMDLEDAGIVGSQIMATHDDALFSESADPVRLHEALLKAGLSADAAGKGYRVLQFHYWGLRSQGKRITLLDQIETVVRHMVRDGLPVVLISMTPVDDAAVADLRRRCLDLDLPAIVKENDFRVMRGVISAARLCVAMKHHPLIFALGEGVPVISLARSEYYMHKNSGALALFDMQEFNLDLESLKWNNEFEELFERTDREAEILSWRIRLAGEELQKKGRIFDQLVRGLISGAAEGEKS
ncbi:MAG: polysaccharide pyruvyl transferase family protein [Candidatus Aminicenantes bacterium]|nr:polysaccharide pyruvyl transferase family protein [Candidatus Aminicenantes bacterium]